MRLIDADVYETEMSKAYGDDWDRLHILDDMPTIDAVEQKHGHWIEHKLSQGRNKRYKVYECSYCNKVNGKFETPYCHYCGAKMDEVSE